MYRWPLFRNDVENDLSYVVKILKNPKLAVWDPKCHTAEPTEVKFGTTVGVLAVPNRSDEKLRKCQALSMPKW